jgi:hypothetical protein
MLDDIIRLKARALRDLSSDDILGALGLERRTTALDSAIPTGLAFVAGLAAGAGLALLLAPKSGREIREEISSKASELTGRLSTAASEVADEVRHALPGAESRENARTGSTASSGRTPS